LDQGDKGEDDRGGEVEDRVVDVAREGEDVGGLFLEEQMPVM
jgi:hypothetical protein